MGIKLTTTDGRELTDPEEMKVHIEQSLEKNRDEVMKELPDDLKEKVNTGELTLYAAVHVHMAAKQTVSVGFRKHVFSGEPAPFSFRTIQHIPDMPMPEFEQQQALLHESIPHGSPLGTNLSVPSSWPATRNPMSRRAKEIDPEGEYLHTYSRLPVDLPEATKRRMYEDLLASRAASLSMMKAGQEPVSQADRAAKAVLESMSQEQLDNTSDEELQRLVTLKMYEGEHIDIPAEPKKS